MYCTVTHVMSWKVKVSCWALEGGFAFSQCVWCFFRCFTFTIIHYICFIKTVFVNSVVWLLFMLRLMSRVMTAFSRRTQLLTRVMTAFSRGTQLLTRVSIANRPALTSALQVWVFDAASMTFNPRWNPPHPASDLLLQSSIENTLLIYVEH